MTVATGLTWWHDADGFTWDRLHLAGETWPGLWVVTGQGVSRKLDVKRVKGSDQATIADEGYNPSKMTLNGTIWTREQWRDLQKLLPLIHPKRKGGSRTPLQIIHPQANFLGVDNVYVESIGNPDLDRSTGIMTISIGVLEWVPVPKPVKKSTGKGAGKSAKPKGNDKNAWNNVRLADESPDEAAAKGLTDEENSAVNNAIGNSAFDNAQGYGEI